MIYKLKDSTAKTGPVDTDICYTNLNHAWPASPAVEHVYSILDVLIYTYVHL